MREKGRYIQEGRDKKKEVNIVFCFQLNLSFFFHEEDERIVKSGKKRKVATLTWFQLGGSRYTGTEEKTMFVFSSSPCFFSSSV